MDAVREVIEGDGSGNGLTKKVEGSIHGQQRNSRSVHADGVDEIFRAADGAHRVLRVNANHFRIIDISVRAPVARIGVGEGLEPDEGLRVIQRHQPEADAVGVAGLIRHGDQDSAIAAGDKRIVRADTIAHEIRPDRLADIFRAGHIVRIDVQEIRGEGHPRNRGAAFHDLHVDVDRLSVGVDRVLIVRGVTQDVRSIVIQRDRIVPYANILGVEPGR